MTEQFSLELFEDFSCGAITACKTRFQEHLSDKGLTRNELSGEYLAIDLVLHPRPGFGDDQSISGGIFSWYYLYLKSERNLNFSQAALCITKALEFSPSNLFLLEKGAQIHERAGHYDPAIRLYSRLLQKSPKNTIYRKSLIKCLYYSGSFPESLAECRKYPQLANDSDIQLIAGYSLFRLGKMNEAEVILTRIRGKEKLPTFKEVKNRTPQPAEVLARLKAEPSGAENFKTRQELGFAYLFHGHYDEAHQVFEELKQSYSKQIGLQSQIA